MYNYEESVWKFTHVLDNCILTEQSKVILDITKMQPNPSVTEKTLYSLSVEKRSQEYLSNSGHPFRVAYLAAVVGSDEPGVEILAALPVCRLIYLMTVRKH